MIAIFNNRPHSTRVQKNIELMDLRILGNLCKLVSLSVMVIMACSLSLMAQTPCNTDCNGTNTFVGNNAGAVNTATSNTFVGNNSGSMNTSGQGNAFFGSTAGLFSQSGNDNSYFGASAGVSNTTGSNNSFFGNTAGFTNRASNNSFFGASVGSSNNTGTNNAFFGRQTGQNNVSGSSNSFFGNNAGNNNVSGVSNVFVGLDAGFNNLGSDNSFFGRDAGHRITTGAGNVAIGRGAGPTSANATLSNRLYIDVNTAGSTGSDTPLIYGEFDNDFVRINGTLEVTDGMRGRLELSNTDTDNSVFIGAGAGAMDDGNNSNVFVGGSTGINNTRGFNNSFFGESVGSANTTGDFNSFFGNESGVRITTGQSNSIFGQGSGARITTGSNNVVLGRGAGPTSANAAANNRLYIDLVASGNDGNDNPLIYGEFDNDFVRINGTFEVTGGLTNPSSRTLKNQFVSLDASTILAKLASLNIQQWAYKARPDEKHVGPIAEEFYAAFGLGQGDKNISTIDADGIMMLAIQALQQENAQLAQGMHQKDQQIAELENRLARIEQLLLEKK